MAKLHIQDKYLIVFVTAQYVVLWVLKTIQWLWLECDSNL